MVCYSGTSTVNFLKLGKPNLSLSPQALLERAGVKMNEKGLAQLEQGEIPNDEAVLTAIGSALGLTGFFSRSVCWK